MKVVRFILNKIFGSDASFLRTESNVAITVFTDTIKTLERLNTQTAVHMDDRQQEINRLLEEQEELRVISEHNTNIIAKINAILN